MKERFPGGQRGEGEGGTRGSIEAGGTHGDDALVDKLVFCVGARAGDVAGVIDVVTYFEEAGFVAAADDDTGRVVTDSLRGFAFCGAHFGVYRVEPDGFDFNQDVVAAGGRCGELDFACGIGAAAVFDKLDGFHSGRGSGCFHDAIKFASVGGGGESRVW